MAETIRQKIEYSPFKNIYWFSRHLLNTDQYGALGKSKETQMLRAINSIENLMIQNSFTDKEKLSICKGILANEIKSMNTAKTKTAVLASNLIDKLNEEINTLDDLVVFCITMKYVVAPINHAIAIVPSNDKEFCYKSATAILDTLGEQNAGKVISTWDNLGVKGCLDAERAVVVEEFTKLIDNISKLNNIEHSSLDDNLILTAFVQEFERRLGQKRKARGGNSLETVVSFLFDYYKFSSTEAPSHFDPASLIPIRM